MIAKIQTNDSSIIAKIQTNNSSIIAKIQTNNHSKSAAKVQQIFEIRKDLTIKI